MASSVSGPFNPADGAGVTAPFDMTIQGVSPATALVEVRGSNGLLLPATLNPKEASGGTVVIQNITSLTGDRGAAYAGGGVMVVNRGTATATGSSSVQSASTASATGSVVIYGDLSFPYSDNFSSDRLATDYSVTGSWAVSSGILHFSTASSESPCVLRTNSPADGYVEAVFKPQNANTTYMHLYARYSDATHVIKAYVNVGTGDLASGYYNGGSWVSGPAAYNDASVIGAGKSFTVRLTYSGSTVTVQLNGVTRQTFSCPLTTAGRAGMACYLASGGDAHFDDFAVT